MLVRLEVDNFKTLNQFCMDFSPMTVVVGNNAAGKSTILQVLDLMCSSTEEDFSCIFSRRNWNAADLKSKCREKSSSKLSLKAVFAIKIDGVLRHIRWDMTVQYLVQRNLLLLHSESVYDADNDRILLDYSDKGLFLCDPNGHMIKYPRLSGDSSVLKLVIDAEKDGKAYPELTALKKYLQGMRSFELLSPDQMRASSRGKSKNLSISGRNLPSFLKNMTEDQKRGFLNKLHLLLDEQIEDVTTETKGKPGWTYVNITEKYKNIKYTVSSRHLSDGMLRLLALIGLSESEDGSLLLLDEIENGVNSCYAENLMKIFYSMCESGKQLLMTTHSVVFLDYVNKNDIIYLYRDRENGNTVSIKLFELPELEKKLEYMYPGEIIYNTNNKKLIEMCLSHL